MVELAEMHRRDSPPRGLGDVRQERHRRHDHVLTVARAQTKKRKILVANGAYHGAAPWCTPAPAGATPEDRAHLGHYVYNDPASVGTPPPRPATTSRHPGQPVQARRRIRPGTGRPRVRPRPARAVRRHRGRADPRRRARRVPAAPRVQLGTGGRGPGPVGLEQGDRERPGARRRARQRRVPRRRGQVYVTGSFWFSAVAMAAAVATVGALRRRRPSSDAPNG